MAGNRCLMSRGAPSQIFEVLDSPLCYHSLFQTTDFYSGYNTKLCFGNKCFVFFIQNITKEKCVGSINSFNARSGHFTNFLYLYKFSSFYFPKHVFECYNLSH